MAYLTDKQIEDMKNHNANTYGAKRGAGQGIGRHSGALRRNKNTGSCSIGGPGHGKGGGQGLGTNRKG